MLGDDERPGAYASEQRRLVRASVAAEVLTFNPYWREAAAEAGLSRPTSAEDLRALPPRPLAALGPADALVLRTSVDAVRRSGPRPLRRRLRRTRLRRGRAAASRLVLDPLYTPLLWLIEGETPVGCSEADLVRLGELGRRSLDIAGVSRTDAIVGLVPPGPTLSAWQLALGAREAGVPLAGLAPNTSIEAVNLLGPTVLAGLPGDLHRVLGGLRGTVRANVATVLVVTREPLSALERALVEEAVAGQGTIVEMWSPPGVRALWTQCRGGEGVHTWPQAELLEVCGPDGSPVAEGDEGELVWTGLGWRGTVFVRLATGVQGRLVEGRCATCGRTTPRILDARTIAGGRPTAVVEALADAEVGPVKATGGVESVRTLRARRRRAAAAEADDAGREAREAVDVRAVTQDGSGKEADARRDEAAEQAASDERAGVVRAVAREEHEDGDRPVSSQPGRRARSEIGEVGHLPPIPDVGPDATGDIADDAPERWLPDTGEVDAWPAPVLASTEGLAAWQVEHRRGGGHDQLVVHLALADGADLGEVLLSLERSIGATQYVVADEADIAARVAAADGRRVVDRRTRSSTNGTARPRTAVRGGRSPRNG